MAGKAPLAPVNADRLRWARDEAGLTPDEAAKRLHVQAQRLLSWEAATAKPTINQLRNLAKLYRQTPASLFLAPPELAAGSRRPPDFRGRQAGRVSPEVLRELARVRERRVRFLRLHNGPTGQLPEVEDLASTPERAAHEVRLALAVSVSDQLSVRDAGAALQAWISAVEDVGVLVFQMSRIEPSECRGMSVYEDEQPVIVLNGADSFEARTFTLFHELAHLLMHSGGVCDVWNDRGTERLCNAFAGALLLPKEAVTQELGKQAAADALSHLATRFRVSQSAVAIRLRDMGLLTQPQLEDQLQTAARIAAESRARRQATPPSGGPPWHLLQLRNLGSTYVTTVLDALHDDVISTVDAAYFLESKLPGIARMEEELVKRASA